MKEQTQASWKASLTRLGVMAVGLLLVGLLVISGSRAAFTASTSNSANSLDAGTVTLTDDDTAAAMFTVSDMVPGQQEVRCILVSYTGSVADPAAVKLYSGGYADSGNFAEYLNLTVEEGTGGVFGDCSSFVFESTIESGGTVTDFDTASTSYATGVGAWDPSSTPESKAYRFTLELDPATPDTQQGESVTGLTFTWEIQS